MRPPRRWVPNIRHLHGTFTAIYTIVAAFLIGAPIFFVNYEVVFQVGLLGFWIGTAFLMLSVMMIGKEMLRAAGCITLFTITYRHTVAIIFCCVACIIFSFFYLWNLIQILSMCSSFQMNHTMHHHHHLEHTEIDVLVSYHAPFNGIIRQQVLLLKYGLTTTNDDDDDAPAPPITDSGGDDPPSQHKIMRQKPLHFYSLNQSFLRHLLRQQQQEDDASSPADGDETALHFSLLDHEINNLLAQEYEGLKQRSSFSVRTARPIYTTTLQEDLTFQELRARKICRNEQGFAIFWLVFIVLSMVMNLVTIGVYAWLRCFYK